MDNIDNQKYAFLYNQVSDQIDTQMDFDFVKQKMACDLSSKPLSEKHRTNMMERDVLDLIELILFQQCDDDVVHWCHSVEGYGELWLAN